MTAGTGIEAFLNVELPKVQERRADLVLSLKDETILHIEFQSHNDRDMPYREGIYCLLLGQKYRRRVRQVVLYVGQAKMRMKDGLDLRDTKVAYRLMDIREMEAEALLQSGRPGDFALAVLARGGGEKLSEIVRRASMVTGPERSRVLAQLGILSGLRGLSGRLTMELQNMGISVDIAKNEFLQEVRKRAKTEMLLNLLDAKFGPLPQWATDRLDRGSPSQIERWAKKVLTANTLEGVLGKK
jgi:hypothetical protein